MDVDFSSATEGVDSIIGVGTSIGLAQLASFMVSLQAALHMPCLTVDTAALMTMFDGVDMASNTCSLEALDLPFSTAEMIVDAVDEGEVELESDTCSTVALGATGLMDELLAGAGLPCSSVDAMSWHSCSS